MFFDDLKGQGVISFGLSFFSETFFQIGFWSQRFARFSFLTSQMTRRIRTPPPSSHPSHSFHRPEPLHPIFSLPHIFSPQLTPLQEKILFSAMFGSALFSIPISILLSSIFPPSLHHSPLPSPSPSSLTLLIPIHSPMFPPFLSISLSPSILPHSLSLSSQLTSSIRLPRIHLCYPIPPPVWAAIGRG